MMKNMCQEETCVCQEETRLSTVTLKMELSLISCFKKLIARNILCVLKYCPFREQGLPKI